MTDSAKHSIEQLETDLWGAADNLRANSKLTSSEYCMPVLGVIFLRHATNRYDVAAAQILAEQAAGKMPKRTLVKGDFLKRRALLLPKEARYDELLKLPKGANLGTALVKAMDAIEREFEPLKGQLPKEYDKFEADLLEDLLRVFDSETLRTASGDVFGRIYEYFLMKFAMQGAQDNGEFFTPPSLVQTIVNVIEPDHGTVFDPACGSGGMFVQSSHFIERLGQDTAHRVTFYGQEKTATTIVWLYRGQSDRFLGLVQSYLDRTLSEAALIAGQATALQAAYKAVVDATAAFLKFLLPSPGTPGEGPGVRALRELVSERDSTAKSCFASLHDWSGRISKNWKKPCEQKLSAQKKRLAELDPLAQACRDLVKDVDLVCKLSGRVIDTAEKDFAAREHDDWGNRAISKLAKELDERRKDLVEQLKRTAYFERQAHWLLSRFPDGKFAAVSGLCRAVTLKDIEAADWSLTPGRYVGVAPAEVDDDFDFEQSLKDIHIELADLNEEAVSLAAKIQENFGGLGI